VVRSLALTFLFYTQSPMPLLASTTHLALRASLDRMGKPLQRGHAIV
jgi:hypothetical protein